MCARVRDKFEMSGSHSTGTSLLHISSASGLIAVYRENQAGVHAGLSYDSGPEQNLWVLILPRLLHVQCQKLSWIEIRAIN
jgi:hypothetical protein